MNITIQANQLSKDLPFRFTLHHQGKDIESKVTEDVGVSFSIDQAGAYQVTVSNQGNDGEPQGQVSTCAVTVADSDLQFGHSTLDVGIDIAAGD